MPLAKSLGVAFADVDEDGWIDIVVANDTVQNFLFHNQGDGTFREIAAATGIAFDMNGNARGAMGIDVARFRDRRRAGHRHRQLRQRDDRPLRLLRRSTCSSWTKRFRPASGPVTRTSLTFGLFYFDYDLDGRLDLLHRQRPPGRGHQPRAAEPALRAAAAPVLELRAAGRHGIPAASPRSNAGPDLFKPLVGRGASYADIDGDGDLDVLVTATGQPPRLLRNDQAARPSLAAVQTHRHQVESRRDRRWVEVELEDRMLRQQVMPSRSYLSQVELPVTFGLGPDDKVRGVTVHWPRGGKQDVDVSAVDRVIEVTEP